MECHIFNFEHTNSLKHPQYKSRRIERGQSHCLSSFAMIAAIIAKVFGKNSVSQAPKKSNS